MVYTLAFLTLEDTARDMPDQSEASSWLNDALELMDYNSP